MSEVGFGGTLSGILPRRNLQLTNQFAELALGYTFRPGAAFGVQGIGFRLRDRDRPREEYGDFLGIGVFAAYTTSKGYYFDGTYGILHRGRYHSPTERVSWNQNGGYFKCGLGYRLPNGLGFGLTYLSTTRLPMEISRFDPSVPMPIRGRRWYRLRGAALNMSVQLPGRPGRR